MRQGFLNEIQHDSGMQEALDPSLFIQRHFGNDRPEVLFNQVLTGLPDKPDNSVNPVNPEKQRPNASPERLVMAGDTFFPRQEGQATEVVVDLSEPILPEEYAMSTDPYRE